MLDFEARREHPELKDLVAEASHALTHLDADRLQELALSCQALNRELKAENEEARQRLARQSRDAARDMAVFARVLEATRANLKVMNRLRELRAERLEYGNSGPDFASAEMGAASTVKSKADTGSDHGNN